MGKDEKDALRRDAQQVLSKKKLRELAEQIDPSEKLDGDVETARSPHRHP
jgi:transcription initiation factor TFIID subunit TAF12